MPKTLYIQVYLKKSGMWSSTQSTLKFNPGAEDYKQEMERAIEQAVPVAELFGSNARLIDRHGKVYGYTGMREPKPHYRCEIMRNDPEDTDNTIVYVFAYGKEFSVPRHYIYVGKGGRSFVLATYIDSELDAEAQLDAWNILEEILEYCGKVKISKHVSGDYDAETTVKYVKYRRFKLMATDDNKKVHPLAWEYSTDGGETWSTHTSLRMRELLNAIVDAWE